MRHQVLLFIPGVLFAIGLVVADMTNPDRVLSFLDMAGAWDPSLLFTMGGAVLSFGVVNALVHRREAPLLGGKLPGWRDTSPLDLRLFLGAVLFGVGWGLAGICPGPAITDLALLDPRVVLFVGAMAVGIVVAQRVFGADAVKPADPAGAASPPPAEVP